MKFLLYKMSMDLCGKVTADREYPCSLVDHRGKSDYNINIHRVKEAVYYV